MKDQLLELFGLYGATLVIAFVAGMFPLISVEAFLVGWCAYKPVSWQEFAILVAIGATGHQLAKTICYVAGEGALESRRVKPMLDRWRPRIERWNKYPRLVFFLACTVGIPPMWLVAFIAKPLMNIRFVPFTAVCWIGRAGRYAVVGMIPMLAR